MLATAVSSSSSGRPADPLLQAVAVDQRVVAEGEAEADKRTGVEAVRNGRVDAFERVGEPGAERPAVTLVVIFAEQVVRVVVISVHVRTVPLKHRRKLCLF